MNSLARFILLLVMVALVASAACWTTSRLMRHSLVHSIDDHEWLHRQLGITESQDKELEKEEQRFAVQRQEITQTIDAANRELAAVMVKDRLYSPAVKEAVEKVHHAQSMLEEAILQHIFSMKPILTPAQFDKLLALTSEALSNQSDH